MCLARWLLHALAAGPRTRRRSRRPQWPHHLRARETTSAPQHPVPPWQAHRHAAAPTLLPPPPPWDETTTSPIPIPP
ncbi:hypothetical protein BDA96_10G027400 [Sorghum bicolor]|uniref:Uncharacterized protein n=1 Tax=Sorghum bicolor TaxID=4558 RepID=A0A921Q038_SORBI|nr:hypothetical protein BDA96_10G027400 [Sorghum bicolor]